MNPREQWRKNLVKELNELHTAGLSTTDYFTQDLIKTSKLSCQTKVAELYD